MKNKRETLGQPILGGRLLLCMGGGGVGKTSTAAAIAYAAALHGRRCALITVDPARRLRSALGLDQLSAAPTRIDIDAAGTLDAMALDTKRVFDDLIERVAPSAEIAARILGNPLYRELSNELGGSTEYMAMEKLHELVTRDYDLIVVDTPPSAHARDLLGAPKRIAALVDSGAASVLRAPASILRGSRLANATLSAVLKALERWVGSGLVGNLSDFAAAFEPLLAGFRQRAAEVETILRDTGTSALLVTTPESAVVRTTGELCADLAANRVKVAGIIANQVHKVGALRDKHRRGCPAALRDKLRSNYDHYALQARRDRAALRQVSVEIAPVLATIPRFAEPVSSLAQLAKIAAILSRQID